MAASFMSQQNNKLERQPNNNSFKNDSSPAKWPFFQNNNSFKFCKIEFIQVQQNDNSFKPSKVTIHSSPAK